MQHTRRKTDTLTRVVAANVKAEAARSGLRYPAIAPHLDLEVGQIGRKMRGEVKFTIDELGILAVLFGHVDADGNPDPTVFFQATPAATLHAVA